MFGWFKKKKIDKKPQLVFKEEWNDLLTDNVLFYKQLSEKDKTHFKQRIVDFLNDTKLTGVGCEIEDLDRLLIASSAIIPVFNFPTWKYYNLKEVILRPEPFNTEFKNDKPNNVTGMVGYGFMSDKMFLSKKSLRQGFIVEKDKKNVGIHEFVHLVDGMDGNIDGLPKVLMKKQYAIPWMKLIRSKINEIQKGKNEINPYGATNEQEFFAVLSEYFFENPNALKSKHPDLYKMLAYFYSEEDK